MAKRLPKKTAKKTFRAQKPLTEEQLGSVSGGGLGRTFIPVEPIRLTPVDPIRSHPGDTIQTPVEPIIPVDPIKQG